MVKLRSSDLIMLTTATHSPGEAADKCDDMIWEADLTTSPFRLVADGVVTFGRGRGHFLQLEALDVILRFNVLLLGRLQLRE